jgi:hypothetical protein
MGIPNVQKLKAARTLVLRRSAFQLYGWRSVCITMQAPNAYSVKTCGSVSSRPYLFENGGHTIDEETERQHVEHNFEPIEPLSRLVLERCLDCLRVDEEEETPNKDREHLEAHANQFSTL